MHRHHIALVPAARLGALYGTAVGADATAPEAAPESVEVTDVEDAEAEIEPAEEPAAEVPEAPPARPAALPPAVRDAIAETEPAALEQLTAAPSEPVAAAPSAVFEPSSVLDAQAPTSAPEPTVSQPPAAPETADVEDPALAGLLAELDGTTAETTDVSIPTGLTGGGVNPMARASSAFLLALFVLAGLLAHPRTRGIVLERLRAGAGAGGRGGAPARIEVRSSVSLGAGQRVVTLEADGVTLLVGLSQGRMDVLHTFGAGDAVTPTGLVGAPEPAAEELPFASSLGALFAATRDIATDSVDEIELDDATPVTASPGVAELVAAWSQRGEPAAQEKAPLLEDDAELPWWMEGATSEERVRLADDADALVPAASSEDLGDGAVTESVLAQLRVARVREELEERRAVEQRRSQPQRSTRRPRLATLGRVADDEAPTDDRPRRRGLPRAVLGVLVGLTGLATLGFGGEAFAGDAAMTLDLGADTLGGAVEGGAGASTAVKLLVTLTLLAVAPAIVLSMTSFTRLIVVFSLMRQAIGVQQAPPNQVLVGLALFLTWFVMGPTFERVGDVAVEPYFEGEMSEGEALSAAMGPMRDFMMRHTREKDLALMLRMSQSPRPETRADVPTRALVPAFMISELKTAFQIGFLIYIPFLIIDLVVATILLAMGMMVLPPVVISLPFKLLLFVFVDGWNLLVGSLVTSFA